MAVNGKKRKMNDRGSALVSVLVVTTFITILATTMMYIAAMNYQQKLTDYQNKDSFYNAEKALDELKSLMVADVQEAYVYACNRTNRHILLLGTGADRNEYYEEEFRNKLAEIWTARYKAAKTAIPDDAQAKLAAVRSVMIDKGGAYEAEADCIYKVADFGVYEVKENAGDATSKRKFVIKGVQAKATSDTSTGSYTTFLYTDICLESPAVDWNAEGSAAFAGDEDPEERKTIAFTDYVSYINWHKGDYDESENGAYNTELGTNLTPLPVNP